MYTVESLSERKNRLKFDIKNLAKMYHNLKKEGLDTTSLRGHYVDMLEALDQLEELETDFFDLQIARWLVEGCA